jgi:NACHT domain
VLLIAVAIGVFILSRLLTGKGLAWVAQASEVASLVLVVVGVLVVPVGRVAGWVRRPQPPTPEEIAAARNNLQAALSGAWSEEGSEVYEDLPMRVRFGPWIEAVDSQGPQDAARVDAPAAEQSQAGGFDSIADAFSQEPRYRRVVLGEAGAGKTVLVTELQRKLVEAPRPGDPLPVIVRAAAWRPDRQSLLDWLADQLAADYGWLPVTLARALVARGMVLPILDGLDEMDRSLRPSAIARINKHHVYRPLVVTSREKEYRDAANRNGAGVKGMVVVAVQPLLPADTMRYLDPSGKGAWARVLGEMDTDSSELARVLANPLMLWLARLEYQGKSPDNLTFFGSGRAVERYLLDEFVPAVYAGDSARPTAGQFRCTAPQAKRWLGHLGAPVLAWWDISGVAGHWRRLGIILRTAVLYAVAAILGIWVLERHGAFTGHVNLAGLLLDGPVGRLIQSMVNTIGVNVKDPARQELTTASHVIDEVFSHSVLISLGAAFVAIGVALRLSLGPSRAPARLRLRAWGVLAALFLCCVLLGLAALAALLLLAATHWPISAAAFFGSRSTWIVFSSVSVLGLISLPGTFIGRSDTSGTVSPEESLHLDRQCDLIVTLSRQSVVGLATWMFCGTQIALAFLIYAVTATAVSISVGGQNSFASRSYMDARIWLAIQGQAPWRTMDFLADANRRGVLRQVGAAYQFRHARLLERAGEWRSGPTRLDELKSRVRQLLGQLSGPVDKLIEPARERVRWRREDSLEQLDEEARPRQPVDQNSPDAVLPEFSEALDDLAHQKWWSDERARAAALINLLNEYQTLSESDPALRPGLARALRDSASSLPWDEALRVTEKAVECYGKLVETNPAEFLPGLAQAAHDLANRLSKLDRLEEAVNLTSEIVDVTGRLADADPANLLPVLASALSDLSYWLWESQAGQRSRLEESASAQREAAAIYRELAEADSARFGRSAARSLDILAFTFHQLEKRHDELTAIREAFDAYCERARCIAAIRRQIAESDLATILKYHSTPVRGRQLLRQGRPGQRKKALAAAMKAAAACRKLAESQPTEYLLDLAEAVNGLAAELKSAGRRREARILLAEHDRICSTYRRSAEILYQEALEVQPLDRMGFLTLQLWKLGEHQEALADARTTHALAPANDLGMATRILRHASLARLVSLIRRELSRIGAEREVQELEEERKVRQWRQEARARRWRIPDLKQRAKKDPDAWRDLASAQDELAMALERQSDALDTLAFRQWVAGRDDDARAAMRQANDVHQEAARTRHELRNMLSLSGRSDPAQSPGTLALRLQASRGGASNDHSLRNQTDTPPMVSLDGPSPIADSAQSDDLT